MKDRIEVIRGDITKQMTELRGVPLLIHTLRAFEASDCIHEIIIVAKMNEIPAWEKLCREHNITKVSKIVQGGYTRQQSVLCGFEAINKKSKFVAISDGARCLVTPEQIKSDTVKIADKKGFIDTTADRDTVWLAQTPQVFKTNLYRAAAYTALKKGFEATDDNSLVENVGHPIRLVECGAQNIKITTREDIAVADGVLAERERIEKYFNYEADEI